MRYTKYDLAIAILKVYNQNKGKTFNRYNILGGRGGYTGDIEYILNTVFTNDERALAGQVIAELEGQGLISPTYEDIVSPGDWLRITPLGEQALKTGALDRLDSLLLTLSSEINLIQMRYGAYEAILSHRTDWQRHAATSCRELITKVLHAIAPDEEIKKSPGFIPDTTSKNGITRKMRIKFYLKQKELHVSESDSKIIEKASDLIEACYNKLAAVTHTDKQEVVSLVKLTEDALFFLLNNESKK